MDFDYSPRCQQLRERLLAFTAEHILPNETAVAAEIAKNRAAGNAWQHLHILEALKAKAREAGLWNLFLPHGAPGPAHAPSAPQGGEVGLGRPGADLASLAPEGLSNLDYAPLAEIMGRTWWAPEVFNCSAPDTGNMEVLARYGSAAHQERWLKPLLRGEIRSAFLMTEPAVASSDATNIECSIRRDGDEYVINGRKWWSSGAGDPRCAVYIVMGKTDPEGPRHEQQSMILVPAATPGVSILRHLPVFGYDDAPHGHMEIELKDVRVPVDNILVGEGKGFAIAQGRLGPGRIHHCMRSIGAAERALELMTARAKARTAFGKTIAQQTVWQERIAESRCAIDQARLLTLKAAWMMDKAGNKAAQAEIAMIKIVAPNVALKVIDWAIQCFGGMGVSDDTPLAMMYAHQRTLRLADGPDEVHRNALAKLELGRHA